MKKIMAVVFGVFFALSASAIHIRPDAGLYETDGFYHENQGSGFAKVKGSCCTGTLIDPYWVVTATHVSSSKWSVQKFEEKTPGNYTLIAEQKSLSDLADDPWGPSKFVIMDDTGEPTDLVLFRLDNPFTIIKPATLLNPHEHGWELGGVLGYVPNRTGKFIVTGSFRFRSDKDYSSWPNVGWLTEPITDESTRFESSIAAGDSGSGVYIELGGKLYLTGAMSYVWHAGSKRGQTGVSTVYYYDQIMKIIRENSYIKYANINDWNQETAGLTMVATDSPVVSGKYAYELAIQKDARYRISFALMDNSKNKPYSIRVQDREIALDIVHDNIAYTELSPDSDSLDINIHSDELINFEFITIHQM